MALYKIVGYCILLSMWAGPVTAVQKPPQKLPHKRAHKKAAHKKPAAHKKAARKFVRKPQPPAPKHIVIPTATKFTSKFRDDITALFIQALEDAYRRFLLLESLFKDKMPQQLSSQHRYKEMLKIQLIDKDPVDPSKFLGMMFTFDDAGHGNLDPFSGFVVDITLDFIPEPFHTPLVQRIKALLMSLINGQLISDPTTGTLVLRSSPVMEFLFKVTLLTKDFAHDVKTYNLARQQVPSQMVGKAIDAKTYGAETLLLAYRLAQVPGIKTAQDIIEQMPAPFKIILGTIKISGKTFTDYFSTIWDQFYNLVHYDFTQPTTSALGNSDIPEIINIMVAVFLRAMADYTKAYDTFVATPAGKSAEKDLQITKNRTTFNKQLPGYDQLKKDAQDRLIALFKRFKYYRNVKQKLIDKVKPFADPLLAPAGLSIDALFPPDNQFALEPADQTMLTDTDNLLSADSMLAPNVDQVDISSGAGDLTAETGPIE